MKKYRFEDAHITDLIKCGGKAEETARKTEKIKMAKNCFRFLEEEISIIDPDLIVAVGKDEILYEYLKKLPQSYGDRLYKKQIMHYSYVERFKNKKKKFDR